MDLQVQSLDSSFLVEGLDFLKSEGKSGVYVFHLRMRGRVRLGGSFKIRGHKHCKTEKLSIFQSILKLSTPIVFTVIHNLWFSAAW